MQLLPVEGTSVDVYTITRAKCPCQCIEYIEWDLRVLR